MNWSDLNAEQRNKSIKKIWREGMSARDIGKELSASRAAICGHYKRNRDTLSDCPLPMGAHEKHRKGILLPHIAERYKKRDNPELKEKPGIKADIDFDVEDIPSTADDGLNVSLIDNTGCWWPLNGGGPYVFCGHARLGAYSYCERHVIRSRGVGSESERRAHRVSARHLEVG